MENNILSPPTKIDQRYMRRAKQIATDPNLKICPSRQIGVVIANTDTSFHSEVSNGYNGPPRGMPHCDSEEWFRVFWAYLNDDEKNNIVKTLLTDPAKEQEYTRVIDDKVYNDPDNVVGHLYKNCKQCPRKLAGIASGEKLHICSCAHAERNAIANAALNGVSVKGCTMYCWCQLPCHECATVIINAGIRKIVCLSHSGSDYSPSSRHMFRLSGVVVEEFQSSLFDDK